ncbi:S1C family serine protease [Saccharopolyspora taberi]|uniref:S1C family serine protease n=1 Tax=Saccharopolyspora taberi TaxID=60895 RepID=UPI0031DA43FF
MTPDENTAQFPGQPLPPPPPPAKSSGVTGGVVAVALIAGLVGGAAGVGGTLLVTGSGSTPTSLSQHNPTTGTQISAQSGTVQFAAEKVSPSTIDIGVQSGYGSSEGTGVVLTADGFVLTNNHVVGNGGQITVTLSDGRKVSAKVVGTSPSYDLAVIKLDGVSGLAPAELGKSSDLKVGQPVVAIGSPLGLEGTVTSGIVSALDRTVQVQGDNGEAVVYNGLQTDASINPGNSGGPLVNVDGQVIGINSSIRGNGAQNASSGSIGLGFAIPVDTAARVANEIIAKGVAMKPQLGILGGDSSNGHATISQVVPGGAAEAAGIKPGETVLKVGDKSVTAFTDLMAQIGAHAPGSKVTLTVADTQGNNPRQVEVTLGSVEDKAPQTAPGSGQSQELPFGGGFPYGR